MLNENLMDSKDIIIAKLKLAIKEFQEYDIERKKYYSNALVELGKLKDEIEELRGINKYSKSYIAKNGMNIAEKSMEKTRFYNREDLKAYDYFDKMPVVSEERIREELTKCFKYNSSLALGWLSELTDLRDYIFKNTNLWLKPTSEK